MEVFCECGSRHTGPADNNPERVALFVNEGFRGDWGAPEERHVGRRRDERCCCSKGWQIGGWIVGGKRKTNVRECGAFLEHRVGKEMGLICRKIDWTGVTFALVLLTSIDTSLRRLSRRATTWPATDRRSDFRKIARESFLLQSNVS